MARDGILLSIPGLDIEVARECSSIRSSMPLIVIAKKELIFALYSPNMQRVHTYSPSSIFGPLLRGTPLPADSSTASRSKFVQPGCTTEYVHSAGTTINRQLFQAMNQMERLQRLRKGENVPAPLTLQVSHDAPTIAEQENSERLSALCRGSWPK